ncbi:MAG: metallopeptidase TldD-related protein [Sphingomicrobium sp.]
MLDPAAAQSLAQSLVARAISAGATAADSIYAGNRSSSVEVRLGALDSVDSSEGEKIGLRLFLGQRSASVASSDLSEESMATLVERCLAMAGEAPEDRYAGLASPELLELGQQPEVDSFDAADPGPADLRARALEAEGAALAVTGVTISGGAGASASSSTIALATSGGFVGAYRSSRHGCSASVIAGEGSRMERDHAWHGTHFLADLDQPETIGRLAGERTIARLGSSRAKPGRYPILFDPRVSATLLGHFAEAISGSSVARGTSLLKDRLGEQVFGQGVTIIDDPLHPRGLRSHPFDGEGVRVGRRELVSGGRPTQWIAESASARQLDIAPTGHAVRAVSGAPGAAPSNMWMEPGTRSRSELLAAFPEAVLVIELIGSGVNSVTGDYSRGAVGFMVRGGEIAEPLSEITIASNLIEMFASLEPASDLEYRHGIDAPTILIPEMTVASA